MKLKKISACLLICFMFFSVIGVGCAGNSKPDTSPEYKFETDCQYYNCGFGTLYGMAESPDSVYYMTMSGYIKVIDKERMIESFLCNKPECLHDKIGSSYTEDLMQCNAYVNGMIGPFLVYYDGYLYITRLTAWDSMSPRQCVLTRITLDGSERKDVWNVDWKEDISGSIQSISSHRGKIYFVVGDNVPITETDGPTSAIISYDLKSKKEQLFYPSVSGLMDIKFIGNNAYIRLVDADDPNLYNIVCKNLSTNEETLLEHCYSIFHVEDELYVHRCIYQKEEDSFSHSLMTLDSETMSLYENDKIDINYSHDTEYIKQFQVFDSFLFVTDGYDREEIRVYDIETGTLLHQIPIPEDTDLWFFAQMSVTTNGKLLLFTYLNEEYSTDSVYCNISDIGTENFQWYGVEKVN